MKSLHIAGFALTQLPALSVAGGLVTVIVWFFGADYYVSRCAPNRPWLEYLFVVLPVMGILISSFTTALVIWMARTPKTIGTSPTLAPPRLCPEQSERRLLDDLAFAHEGLARQYILWVRSGPAGQLHAGGWAFYWLSLIVLLTIPGLHCQWMELVAQYVSRVPPCWICKSNYTGLRTQDKIVAVDVEVRDSGEGQTEGPWTFDPDWALRLFILNKPGNGTLATGNIFRFYVYAGDFPRVERKLQVRLLRHPLGCTFPANTPAINETVGVRAGKSSFELICPPTPGSFSKRFNVSLDLQTYNGTSLWTATIQ